MWGEGEGDVSSSSRHLGPRLLFPSSNGLILGQREKERDIQKERYREIEGEGEGDSWRCFELSSLRRRRAGVERNLERS